MLVAGRPGRQSFSIDRGPCGRLQTTPGCEFRRPDPDRIFPGHRIVIPDIVASVTARGATRIRAFGNREIIHFVTPKGSGNVTLTATINPDTPSMRRRISREGATASAANSLTATAPKNAARKHVVRIKVAGCSVPRLIDALEQNQVVYTGGSETEALQVDLNAALISALRKITGVDCGETDPASDEDISRVLQTGRQWWEENKQK